MRNTDIILIVPLVWGAYRGFVRGFIRELTSIVALAIVLFCSLKYTGALATYIGTLLHNSKPSLSVTAAAFAIIFAVVFTITVILAKKLEKLSENLHLSLINHFFGGAFGILKWALLVSIGIYLMHVFQQRSGFNLVKFNTTWLYNQLASLAPKIFPGYFAPK